MSTLSNPAMQPAPPVRELSDFLSTCWVELRRAERYHVFLSLARFEIGTLKDSAQLDTESSAAAIADRVCRAVRVSDAVAVVDQHTVAVLFPETSRQGAEVATRRLQGAIAEALGLNGTAEKVEVHKTPSGSFAALGALPTAQLSSYPDAAGARSIPDLLTALQSR